MREGTMSDIELARGWTIEKVRGSLNNEESRMDLIDFVRARYNERFFGSLHLLAKEPSAEQRHGFAIMALCCLLVETMESYRRGLPSTNVRELEKINKACANGLKVSDEYKISDKSDWPKRGTDVFKSFFESNRDFFGSTDGVKFYDAIRNGLLHQGQTKDGWRIRRAGRLWDEDDKTLNRALFAQKLEEYFKSYLANLRTSDWNKGDWPKVRRKIWWLATLSEGTLIELSE
jgi:hypothetical protein